MDTLIMARDRLNRPGNGASKVLAVIACEDSATGTRASQFCESLAKQLGQQRALSNQVWLLNELRVPRLCTIAASDAAEADVILISLHHTEAVPGELKSWVGQWLAIKKRRPRLLLALLDSACLGLSTSLRAYLDGVAKQGGMDYLVQSEETLED